MHKGWILLSVYIKEGNRRRIINKEDALLVVLSNSGFLGDNNFETMRQDFKSCNPVSEIYRNCGRLLKSKGKKIKKLVNNYTEYVKEAGYELVTNYQVSDEIRNNLAKEIMPIQEYIEFLGM